MQFVDLSFVTPNPNYIYAVHPDPGSSIDGYIQQLFNIAYNQPQTLQEVYCCYNKFNSEFYFNNKKIYLNNLATFVNNAYSCGQKFGTMERYCYIKFLGYPKEIEELFQNYYTYYRTIGDKQTINQYEQVVNTILTTLEQAYTHMIDFCTYYNPQLLDTLTYGYYNAAQTTVNQIYDGLSPKEILQSFYANMNSIEQTSSLARTA